MVMLFQPLQTINMRVMRNMKLMLLITSLLLLQVYSFAKNTNSLLVVYTVHSNVQIKNIKMFYYSPSKYFKPTGTQVPFSGSLVGKLTFYSFMSNPIRFEIADSNSVYPMCDTIPITINYRGFFIYNSKEFLVFNNISDTLFRSHGQDTIYKELNINFTDEQIQKNIDEYLKNGDY